MKTWTPESGELYAIGDTLLSIPMEDELGEAVVLKSKSAAESRCRRFNRERLETLRKLVAEGDIDDGDAYEVLRIIAPDPADRERVEKLEKALVWMVSACDTGAKLAEFASGSSNGSLVMQFRQMSRQAETALQDAEPNSETKER